VAHVGVEQIREVLVSVPASIARGACRCARPESIFARGFNALEHKPSRILRPRIIVYAALLFLLMSALATALIFRKQVDVDVIRDRNTLYRLLEDGRVENVYNVKILNKTESPHRFVIGVSGEGALSLDPQPARFDVASGEVYPAAVRVRRPAYEPVGSQEIHFTIVAEDAPHLKAQSRARFLAPER
jgi:polyferredoxin